MTLTFPMLLTCHLACRLSDQGIRHLQYLTCDVLCTTHITYSWDFLVYLQAMWYATFPGAYHMRFTVPTMTPYIPYILSISNIHYVINHIPYSKPPYHVADHFPNACYSIFPLPTTSPNVYVRS